MRKEWIGLVFCVAMFSVGANGQVVTGSEFTASPNDTFNDGSHTMSNYGLTWADFSNGTIGPSAMLSGYGGINLYTNGSRRFTITPFGAIGIGTENPAYTLDVAGQIRTSNGITFPDGTVQTTAYPASSTGGTAPIQVENNEVTINSGISTNGSGIKHMRTNASCTTGPHIGNTCEIQIVWPGTPFLDTSYTVTCTPKAFSWSDSSATITSYTILIPDANKTTTSTNVAVENLDEGSKVTITGLNCIAIHD